MVDTPEQPGPVHVRSSLIEWFAVVVVLLLLLTVLAVAMVQAREAARRSQSKNNLRQIGLALHNYHDVSQCLPPGGVFNSSGVPYHSWTTVIDPYTWSAPWYSQIDFNLPWDDPKQIEMFRTYPNPVWQNPRISLPVRPDGLPITNYAGNSWLLYRNSSVSFKDIGETGHTLLAAEARGQFLPLGCPGNWRDVSAGFNLSDETFGLRPRDVTQVLLGDGAVRELAPEISGQVWDRMAGPPQLEPAAERRQRPPFPYQIPDTAMWRTRRLYEWKAEVVKCVLTPDGSTLTANFSESDAESRGHMEWRDCYPILKDLDSFGPIQHVRITGTVTASELVPFAKLPGLKSLTISRATVLGDPDEFRRLLKADVVVTR